MTDRDVVALKQSVDGSSAETAGSDRANVEAERLFQAALERYGEICIAQSDQTLPPETDSLNVLPMTSEIRDLYEQWLKECQPLFSRLSAFPATPDARAFAAAVEEVDELLTAQTACVRGGESFGEPHPPC